MAATIISTLSKDPSALSPILRSPPTRLAAGFTGSTTAFVTRGRSRSNAPGKRGSLVVQMAASKEKKSRDLDMLKGMLSNDDTLLVAGFRFQGLSVKDMIKFRRELPDGANLLVTKNTLMVKASEGTKWEPISECATGMNAWLFVDENIAPAIRTVKGMQKDWKKDGVEVDFTGAVLDGKFIDPTGIAALEKLPTKKDLITMVAVGIKQVPTKLARATNGVPLKMAYGIQAIADGDSDIISA